MVSFTDRLSDVALVEVDFPGLGKVEFFGPSVTVVDYELDGPVATISAPIIPSTVVDVLTGDVPGDDRPIENLFSSSTSSTVVQLS